MILYFPVSALMTLFANILNNPLDPRAKSDVRLINLVVTFLSMLGQEAEQGGVHRMLGVCAEFERIAKSVIEKAEKDQASRRKRKNHDATKVAATASSTRPNTASPAITKNEAVPQTPIPVPGTTTTKRPTTTSSNSESNNSSNLSPPLMANEHGASYSPMAGGSVSGRSPSMASSAGWPRDVPVPQNGDFDSFAELAGFPSSDSPPMNMGQGFQQPLLPPDLFSLPMTLDWNWAELSGGAYPTVENGNFGDGMVGQDGQQLRQQRQQQ
jgi:hypothetical protein